MKRADGSGWRRWRWRRKFARPGRAGGTGHGMLVDPTGCTYICYGRSCYERYIWPLLCENGICYKCDPQEARLERQAKIETQAAARQEAQVLGAAGLAQPGRQHPGSDLSLLAGK